jgi:hypothetical protein
MNNFILIFTLAIFSVYGLFGADNKNIDPSKPSEYLTNVGIGYILPLEDIAGIYGFTKSDEYSNLTIDYIIPLSGSYAFDDLNKVQIRTGVFHYTESRQYADTIRNFRTQAPIISYHHLFLKDDSQTFSSFELNAELALPFGSNWDKAVKGDLLGFGLGVQAGFKILDWADFFPYISYSFTFNPYNHNYTQNQMEFGAIVPIRFSENFFFSLEPVFMKYCIRQENECIPCEDNEENNIIYLQKNKISYLINNDYLISGIYHFYKDFKINMIGFEASYYFHN